MAKIDLSEYAPKDFKHEVLPYCLIVLVGVVAFIVGFHAMMGPILTTAVVLVVFLTTAIIVGMLEKRNKEKPGQ